MVCLKVKISHTRQKQNSEHVHASKLVHFTRSYNTCNIGASIKKNRKIANQKLIAMHTDN